MNELYGLPDIPDTTFALAHHTDPVFRNAVDSSVRIDPATIARLTARIYKGDLDTSQDLDRDFYQAVASVMHEAVDKGLKEAGAHAPSSPDDYFHHQLTHSSDVFAAFKVHRAQADIAAQLLDDDGHLRPFREFQQRVLPITSHQCGRWLRTEYDTAVIRAQRAAEWQQFLEEADVLPNLEWMPSTSANPGADHQVFWGTILPISDPFWSEHRPGDRWNCKCSLQATDAKPTPRPRGFSEIANAPQPGLDTNPGTDGAVFSPSHPYFPSSCSQCPFKASEATVPSGSPAGFSNAVKDCMHCAYAAAACTRACAPAPQPFLDYRHQIQDSLQAATSHTTFSNLDSGTLFQNKKSLARLMAHCYNCLECDAASYIWQNPDQLHFVSHEELGQGKDLSDPKDQKNIENKRKRGVVAYNRYSYRFNGTTWVLKTEVMRFGEEQIYCTYPE